MKRRSGHLLIETLVLVTGMSVVLAVSIATLATVLRAEKAGREKADSAASLQRLARQFREDVHAALAVLPAEAGKPWQLAFGPQHTVAYRATADAVERDEADGATRRHESYRLPREGTAQWSVSNDRAIATLAIAAGEPPIGSRYEFRIDAAIARDRRLAAMSPEGK